MNEVERDDCEAFEERREGILEDFRHAARYASFHHASEGRGSTWRSARGYELMCINLYREWPSMRESFLKAIEGELWESSFKREIAQ